MAGYRWSNIDSTAIKSHALVDFVAEWTEVQLPTPDVTHEYWTMYFDGSIMAPGMGGWSGSDLPGWE